jgi:hypothetical protein
MIARRRLTSRRLSEEQAAQRPQIPSKGGHLVGFDARLLFFPLWTVSSGKRSECHRGFAGQPIESLFIL